MSSENEKVFDGPEKEAPLPKVVVDEDEGPQRVDPLPSAEFKTVAGDDSEAFSSFQLDVSGSGGVSGAVSRPTTLQDLKTRDNNENEDHENEIKENAATSGSKKKLSPFEEWSAEDSPDMDGMRKKSVAIQDAKEAAIHRLQEELEKSKETLKLRDVQVEKLSKIRDEMGAELEELTASLFEEAHKMVHDANVKRASAEKKVTEANLKIEVLSAEVQALKALVLTSTPSTPNRHLHPQISPSPEKKLNGIHSPAGSSSGKSLINGHHKRAASHGGLGSISGTTSTTQSTTHNNNNFRSSFGAGGTATPPSKKLSSSSFSSSSASPYCKNGETPLSPSELPLPHPCPNTQQQQYNLHLEGGQQLDSIKRERIDPIAFEEFSSWIEHPVLDPNTPFLARIYAEDVSPCFHFCNKELAETMLKAILANSIVIEPLLSSSSSSSSSLPKSSAAYGGRICALSQLSKVCNYKVRLENEITASSSEGTTKSSDGAGSDADKHSASSAPPLPPPSWHYISDFCRNRVIAVCDFYTYVRYIVQGLVKKKPDAHDTFCHINRLRRNMNLARLGFEPQQL